MRDRATVLTPVRRPALAWTLGFALIAAGCGGDSDFDNAARANTAVAWDDYLKAHPDGSHTQEARERLAALLEDGEWQRAHAAETADAYQRYLRGYPQGAHAHEALVAIANLNLAATPATEAPAEGAPAVTGPATGAITRTAPAAVPPPGGAAPGAAAAKPPARKAAPPAAAAGFRVQLGAFAGGAVAERAWRDLSARHPELAGRTPLISAARAGNGHPIHRLQLAGLDRPGAEALCATLAASKDPCIVVPPTPGLTSPPR
jgi:SPOR domain